ncbi:unnamed protein product [Allacma fusca]|uniref:Uncharacterized protein n=1 Tax=Allacma fusca TaxID=39272 RepID=A0A8J2K7D5_9HEXA|nr:unnamed protein product [Allacma fusca]
MNLLSVPSSASTKLLSEEAISLRKKRRSQVWSTSGIRTGACQALSGFLMRSAGLEPPAHLESLRHLTSVLRAPVLEVAIRPL